MTLGERVTKIFDEFNLIVFEINYGIIIPAIEDQIAANHHSESQECGNLHLHPTHPYLANARPKIHRMTPANRKVNTMASAGP